jgi:hypothetical protein
MTEPDYRAIVEQHGSRALRAALADDWDAVGPSTRSATSRPPAAATRSRPSAYRPHE